MREADRNEQLVAVFGAEFRPGPLAVCGRSVTHVNCDVEDPPANAAHQLVLAPRRGLEMQAAQGEGGGGIGVVVLHKGAVDAEGGEGGLRVVFCEPTPSITVAPRAYKLKI